MTMDRPEFVSPPIEELLPSREQRARFDETSAALEAAAIVRALRERALGSDGRRGISQADLAERTGLSQPRISQIENGDGRDGPTYAVIRKIALACGVDWGTIVRGILVAPVQADAPTAATASTQASQEHFAEAYANMRP